MPWHTVYFKDTGDIYAISYPTVGELPYPGPDLFGVLETDFRPDTRQWQPETHTYAPAHVRDTELPVGMPAGRVLPVDPAVAAEEKAIADAVLAAKIKAAVDAAVSGAAGGTNTPT